MYRCVLQLGSGSCFFHSSFAVITYQPNNSAFAWDQQKCYSFLFCFAAFSSVYLHISILRTSANLLVSLLSLAHSGLDHPPFPSIPPPSLHASSYIPPQRCLQFSVFSQELFISTYIQPSKLEIRAYRICKMNPPSLYIHSLSRELPRKITSCSGWGVVDTGP